MRPVFILITITLLLSCKPQQSIDASLRSDEEHTPYFWALDIHPSEDLVAVGGQLDSVYIYSTKNFQSIYTLPYPGTVTKTKWHPTQNLLAVSVQDELSIPSIIDINNGKWITLDSLQSNAARAIGWNHSGELLAVGDYEGYLTFFDKQGNFIKAVDTDQKAIIGLDWHPFENRLVAVGEKISMYNFESDSLTTFQHRPDEVLMLCIEWHPSGNFFVTGDYGDFIVHHPPLLQFWTGDGQLLKEIIESKAEYRNLKWSPDGSFLATASEQIRLWDKSGSLLRKEKSDFLLQGIDWNSEGTKIMATDDNGQLIIWNERLKRLNVIFEN